MKAITKCSICNKEFEKEIKKINWAKRKNWAIFCSQKCRSAKQSETTKTFECYNCNKKIKKTLSEVKKSKSGNMFCSRSCAVTVNNMLYRRGTNHPSYTNGYSSYRNRALREYGEECFVCGYNVRNILEVHHIDSNRGNNSIDNLVVVCPTHHKEYQLGIRTQIKRDTK